MPTPQTQWLFYAISSGACASLNGVFAKLTTTHLTTSWATGLSHFFGMKEESMVIEVIVRGVSIFSSWQRITATWLPAVFTQANDIHRQFFFGMNLLFNAIMWGLFTRALTLASSTVRVSVINTSANFMLTAMLGFFIFRESLPGEHIQNDTRSRRQEGKESGDAGTAGAEPTVVARGQTYSDEPDAPLGSRSGQALGGDLELVGSERRRSRSADRVGRVSAE
jgi:uncharacterized membrane protein